MIRNGVVTIVVILGFGVGLVPQKAESAGLISMTCFFNVPPVGSGPIPTVGCTYSWGPGGVAGYGRFSTVFECDPGCQVVGVPPAAFKSIINPPNGVEHRFIRANCTGQIVLNSVSGRATSVQVRKNVSTIIQDIRDVAGGLVAPTPNLCPLGGGVSVIP
jgi:hypothetical protein